MDQERAAKSLWPLQEIEVGGLFGSTNVVLFLDSSATILTGENGSGKSTILQAVHCVGLGKWRGLSQLPLSTISLRFQDDEITVERTGEDGALTVRHSQGEAWSPQRATPPAMLRRHEVRLARLHDQMRHAASAAHQAELREQYDLEYARLSGAEEMAEIPPWVADLEEGFKTKLISARRLEHRLRPEASRTGEERPQSVVDRFAEELADRMRQELSQYAAESRRQERSLPSQIVQAMQQGPQRDSEALALEVDELREQVRVLADSLTRVGLLQEEDPDQRFVNYPRDNPSILLAIREVYSVTLQRLQRLTTLRSDLELFADFLGERLSGKRIDLNPRSGIDVVLPRGERIKPSLLSSGEQQLLALGFELLFGTEPRSVVLLDEPELSLHVAWLQGLLSSFLGMGSNRELQFMLATHSPSVVAGFKDHERSLDDTSA